MLDYTKIMSTSSPISQRLILSYIFDWIIIICIAAVGAGFWKVTPNHRPFSPVDPSISFPYVEHEKISTSVLVVVSLIAPAILTALVALTLVPGPALSKTSSRAQIWRLKLSEWNTAWMGLALGLALAFFFTEGLKNLIGKPRPDLLSRCDPDPTTVQQYVVGGDGGQLPLWNLLLSATACRQPDKAKLNDGFASFPSGHSSFSWTGMFYLTLFLCSKFSISIPYLLPASFTHPTTQTSSQSPTFDTPSTHSKSTTPTSLTPTPPRSQAAAPPLYLLLLPLIPISIATYISSSRFSDFRHHGFDILFGSLMGIFFSTLSFRLYHLPIRRGAGWSWGPRGVGKAFWVGVGVGGYGEGGEHEDGYKRRDIELGDRRGDMPLRSSDTT